ncbi:MAG: thioesterase [Porticoccaceae bacterium]|nr:thioesterase [Porticoccaceae bacterium]
MPFTAPDPDYQRRVRDSFAAQTFMSTIGAHIVALEPGRCELALDYDPRLTQQHGFIHGGVVSTLADTSSGYAAFSLMPAQAQVLTTEFKINLLSPARGNGLVARALVLKAGRTLTVCESSVYAVDGDTETLCARALVSLMALLPPSA